MHDCHTSDVTQVWYAFSPLYMYMYTSYNNYYFKSNIKSNIFFILWVFWLLLHVYPELTFNKNIANIFLYKFVIIVIYNICIVPHKNAFKTLHIKQLVSVTHDSWYFLFYFYQQNWTWENCIWKNSMCKNKHFWPVSFQMLSRKSIKYSFRNSLNECHSITVILFTVKDFHL